MPSPFKSLVDALVGDSPPSIYLGQASMREHFAKIVEAWVKENVKVVSAQVIEDRESGRSKGFGFVEMGTDQEAQAAIQGLNGKDHGGRPLTVNEAKPREERGGGGRGGRGGGYGGGGRGGRY